MSRNKDEIRLSDYALSEYKSTSFFVENQFPSIYLEEGQELVALVKSYYRFLETQQNQSVYNNRRMYEYRNVDTTLDSMLLFFKNKFLNGLFFDSDQRFIIKNILDLYRRKGSKEGIELFFKLFFESEVDVYFPSEDIFKPSTSTWKIGSFLQLHGVSNTAIFDGIINRKIFGDKSKAEAFVDNVYFVNVNNQIIPIVFISGTKGNFYSYDLIYSLDPDVTYGRVYGSMRKLSVIRDTANSTGGNKVGDIIEIFSDTGFGGKGRVSKVSEDLSGQIRFSVVDGGFGYTLEDSSISISNQSVFFADTAFVTNPFTIGERIQQTNSSSINVVGKVIGKSSRSIGVELDLSQPSANSSSYAIEPGFEIATIDRDNNIAYTPAFVTQPNFTANASVETITNTETITIITDIIGNFANVTLNSLNYSQVPPAITPMSGTSVNSVIPTANTPLNEAFVPETFTLGSIETLGNINPGIDYNSDVFILAEDSTFAPFNLTNQILVIIPVQGVSLFENDIITQTREVKNFDGDTVEVDVKGKIVKIFGNAIYVKQLSFYAFTNEFPLYKENVDIPITIITKSRDVESLPLGMNANITGEVESVIGRILEVDVIDSGFGYVHNGAVSFFNKTKALRESSNTEVIDGVGIANARDQGITEGRWTSTFSHINQEKVLQDSFYYQDYSYEISSSISPKEYETEYKELIHPSGMKLFTKFSKTSLINIDTKITDPLIEVFDNDEL